MKNLIKETSDVLILNTTTFTFASMANVEIMLKIAVLLLSIIYTTDKLIYNRRRRKNEDRNMEK